MENEQTLKKYHKFISARNFPEDPKNTKIRILYSKKYDEHTYQFTMEVPSPLPPPPPPPREVHTNFPYSMLTFVVFQLTMMNFGYFLML